MLAVASIFEAKISAIVIKCKEVGLQRDFNVQKGNPWYSFSAAKPDIIDSNSYTFQDFDVVKTLSGFLLDFEK